MGEGRSGTRSSLAFGLVTFVVVSLGLLLVLWMLGAREPAALLLAPIIGAFAGLLAGLGMALGPLAGPQASPAQASSAAPSVADRRSAPHGGQVTPNAAAAQRMRVRAPWTWSLAEPLSTLETYQESDVWTLVRKTAIEPGTLLAFTHGSREDVTRALGSTEVTVFKVSRLEGEGTVSPADVDRIADVIATHFAKGKGRAVVLPGIETIVESTNVRNVRRMIDLVRDLALESKGAVLVTLDPGSLPSASLSLLERGSKLLHAQAPVPIPA